MLYYYVNNTNRSADIVENSLTINNQIQQRSDNCSFKIFQNTKPSENQDLRIYKGDEIDNIAGTTLTLKGYFQKDVGFFREGQLLHIRIGDADEETVSVLSYDETTLTLVLVAAPTGTLSIGDKIGLKIFGGVVSRVSDDNVQVIQNLEYNIEGVDYTKIFDKKLISDTWEDRDSRYIINDFCNSTINFNHLIDQLDYDDNAAIQAEWAGVGGTALAPTTDPVEPFEADHWGVFSQTTGGGFWYASPPLSNVSQFTGAVNGAPIKGKVGCWIKVDDWTKFTTIYLYLGSTPGVDYIYKTITGADIGVNNTPVYIEFDLASASVGGNPDWTAFDYVGFTVISSANVTMKVAGLRFLQNENFKHYPYVQSTPEIDELRSPQLKPTSLLQLLSKTWNYIWYIDYDRNIKFLEKETEPSPFAITATSNNFTGLNITVDQSQLGNRVIIKGGEQVSTSVYSQVFQGNATWREWKLKGKFKNLTAQIDNASIAHAAEVGTTTTNIKITGHGLLTGDHVVNRTRGVVRDITRIDADNFTVKAVPSQTNGDNITFFGVAADVGIEGISDESLYTYVGNSNEQSVRASQTTATLTTNDYIRFAYNERSQIQVEYEDVASVNALKALGIGDGIFDLDPITDLNIESSATARTIAAAKVSEFSNPVIEGSFKTDHHGLKAGQLININESYRGINDYYVIQKVSIKQRGGEYSDNLEYGVSFGTTLFGWIEFMQKLLSTQDKLEFNVDAVVVKFVTATENMEIAETNTIYVVDGGTFQYEPSVGQAFPTRFNLSDYGA